MDSFCGYLVCALLRGGDGRDASSCVVDERGCVAKRKSLVVLRFVARRAAHHFSFKHITMPFKDMTANQTAILKRRKCAAQLRGVVRFGHFDRASAAASCMSMSYVSWKSGEQRMRDTCDSLYPVSLAMSFCF